MAEPLTVRIDGQRSKYYDVIKMFCRRDCAVHVDMTDWSCFLVAWISFSADNTIAYAHASPDVQKLLESEQDWGFNVIELELLTKQRSVK